MFVEENRLFRCEFSDRFLCCAGDGTTWSPSRQAKESDGIDRIPPPSQARSIAELVQAEIRRNSVGSKGLSDPSREEVVRREVELHRSVVEPLKVEWILDQMRSIFYMGQLQSF